MTNNEQDNLRQSIEALQDFWSNHEDYDIREKAREYIELYESNGNSDHFSWVHPEDAPYIKENGCNAVRWGIPNQILGDIEKAKFIFGLYNPGTHMKNEESNECANIKEYVDRETEKESDIGDIDINFETKEYSENTDFYLEHVISNQSVVQQELLKLYEIYKENPNDYDYLSEYKERAKKVAYYITSYYSGVFKNDKFVQGDSNYKKILNYYKQLFQKVIDIESIVVENNMDYDVEYEFRKALENIAICNVEMVPYRSNEANNIKTMTDRGLLNLPSTQKIADLIIEKLTRDTNTFAAFRKFRPSREDGWKFLLEIIAEEKDINFSERIAPSLHYFSSKNEGENQSASLSKSNIKSYDNSGEDGQSRVSEAVDDLLEELKMQPFVDELNEIIEENS